MTSKKHPLDISVKKNITITTIKMALYIMLFLGIIMFLLMLILIPGLAIAFAISQSENVGILWYFILMVSFIVVPIVSFIVIFFYNRHKINKRKKSVYTKI